MLARQAQHAQECILRVTFTYLLCCRLLGVHEQQLGSKRQGCHACWFTVQELSAGDMTDLVSPYRNCPENKQLQR